MVRKKGITIVALLLMLMAVIAVLYVWKYSFEYQHEYEEYDGQKIIFTEDDEYNSHSGTEIICKSKSILCNGSGAYSVDKTLYITSGGVYTIEGELENIVVRSGDEKPVIMRLNNVSIESHVEPPIYIYKASKFVLSSTKDSVNYVTDKRRQLSEQNIQSSIYSAADLTLNGEGKTVIQSNYRDAVTTENTLKIVSGDWDIFAEDDGISGRIVFQKDGNVVCSTIGDAVKSDKKNNKGLIVLKGGKLITNSQGDGVFSSGNIYADGAEINIQSTIPDLSKIDTSSQNIPSTKGIKSDKGIYVDGGSITTDTSDDSLHAGEIIHVYNGELTLASGDDAIHCDGDVYFDNVNLSITDCYEGIEGAYIEINGGKYHIIAEDDGINATGEASMSALQEGDDMPPDDGQGNQNMEAPPAIPENETEITKTAFVFNDGDLYIEGGGDGIDINGSAEVNGGSVETYCMKDGPEEAFDFDGELYINGGVVFGAGNANMFKLPNEHSKAKNLVCYMDQTYRNGGELVIEDSSGEVIEHHELTGSLGIVIAYGDKIKSGETYTVKMNEKMLGTATIQGTNTVIKPESASAAAGAAGGGAPGGPPPMGADGRPLEPPPDGPGGPGGPPDEPGGAPPDKPDGEQFGTEQTIQNVQEAGNENALNLLYLSDPGSILLIVCMIFVKLIKIKI